jgi:hypothetical protein
MKIPSKLLQGMAAAVTLAGMTGCGFGTSAPPPPVPTPTPVAADPSADPNTGNPINANNQCPVGDPGQPGFRDPCPACGRG